MWLVKFINVALLILHTLLSSVQFSATWDARGHEFVCAVSKTRGANGTASSHQIMRLWGGREEEERGGGV